MWMVAVAYWKKTFKNAYLYLFSSGQIQVGQPKFTKILVYKGRSGSYVEFGNLKEFTKQPSIDMKKLAIILILLVNFRHFLRLEDIKYQTFQTTYVTR